MKPWQEWIERYVHQVTRRLPDRQRADVAEELRSLLGEQVEERRAASDAPAEEIALATIAEFGEPTAAARRYAPVRPALVSSPLQQPLKFTLLLVSGVWLAFTMLWLFEVYATFHVLPLRFDFGVSVGPADLIEGLLSNLGIVLLVFIGIDRVMWGQWADEGGSWDPRDLPPLPVGAPVSRFEAALGAVFTLYLLYVLHLAPDAFVLTVSMDEREPWQLLDPEYRRLLPWLDLVLVPSLLMDAWLLWRGEIGPVERWLQVGLGLLAAGVFFRVAAGGPLTVIDHVFDPFLVGVGIVLAGVAIWRGGKMVRSARSAALVPRANGA